MTPVGKPNRTLIEEVEQAIQKEFKNIGLRKRKGQIFTCELNKEFLGWVGVNRAASRCNDLLEINPVIGVRHQPTEQVLAEVLGEKGHPYNPPTVSIHLGYLMPARRYTPWLFGRSQNENPMSVAKEMVAAINRWGVPFFQDNSTLEALSNTMRAGFGIPDQLAYRLPIAYAIMGESSLAQNCLNDRVRELEERPDPAARRYRHFATAVQSHGSRFWQR